MFSFTNRQGNAMKPLICVRAIVLGLVAITAAPVSADGERSVTAAATYLLPAGAELGPVALQGLEIGAGVFIEADGSASGTFHAVLQGSALGLSRELTLEGKAREGSVGFDGHITFSGTASLDLGDGAPPLPSVAFSVTAGADDVVLVIDSTPLPAAGLSAGAVIIE